MQQIKILLRYIILHKENQIQTPCQGLVRTRDTTGSKPAVPVFERENQHEKSLSDFLQVESMLLKYRYLRRQGLGLQT